MISVRHIEELVLQTERQFEHSHFYLDPSRANRANTYLNTSDRPNKRMLNRQESVRNSLVCTIKAMMCEKSSDTEEHAERMVAISRKIGLALNLNNKQLGELELLSLLHDIGKIHIDNRVLLKEGSLTDEEWILVRKHPEAGYRIAKSSAELLPIAEYILCHHERWDGTGYPNGLGADAIPFLSRIIAIVDAYDAMTQDRPYRKAMTQEEAAAEILRNAGTQFDPKLAELFVKEVCFSQKA